MIELERYICPEAEKVLGEPQSESIYASGFLEDDCIAHFLWENCTGSCNRNYIKNLEYHTLKIYANEEGFNEYEEIKINEKDRRKKDRNIIEGFFINKAKTSVIISNHCNLDLVPEVIVKKLNGSITIEHFYEGYEFLLVNSNKKTFSFVITLYQTVKELIRLIALHVKIEIENISISKDATALIIQTRELKFLISAFLSSETVETERSLLISKLESVKPFFECKPFEHVDWTKLKEKKGTYFEKLVESLLLLESNLIEIQPIGKTNASDRGRDFIVIEKTVDAFNNEKNITWLVQCKFSTKSISTKTLPDWITRSIEHKVDGFWIITNNDLTPNLYDQLIEIPKNKNYQIQTRVWQRSTFDVKLSINPQVFASGKFFNS